MSDCCVSCFGLFYLNLIKVVIRLVLCVKYFEATLLKYSLLHKGNFLDAFHSWYKKTGSETTDVDSISWTFMAYFKFMIKWTCFLIEIV